MISSIWAPASQDSSHVGNAWVGVVSLRGALLSLPTFATAQSRRFFDWGRAVRCLIPLASGRFMHLMVLLFDAALGELSVVARGQPCLLVGDFIVEPTKIPCLAKGISAGLWVDVESAWALAAGLQPSPTCKRTLSAGVVIAGISWLVVLLQLLLFSHVGFRLIGGLLLILLFGLCLTVAGGLDVLLSLCIVHPFGLLLGCPLLIRVGVPSRLRFRGSGKFMMSVFSLYQGMMQFSWISLWMQMMFLVRGSSGLVLLRLHLLTLISFSGGPLPSRGLVLGRGSALFRVVRLGGHKVRKARGNADNALDAADVFLDRDSSIAPLLDMRRRFKRP